MLQSIWKRKHTKANRCIVIVQGISQQTSSLCKMQWPPPAEHMQKALDASSILRDMPDRILRRMCTECRVRLQALRDEAAERARNQAVNDAWEGKL